MPRRHGPDTAQGKEKIALAENPIEKRSIRWVAEQLGHANPELTLRVYAHAMPVDEPDLAFVDFERGTGRHYTAPAFPSPPKDDNAPSASAWRRSGFLERETGFEPATLSLGKGKKRKE